MKGHMENLSTSLLTVLIDAAVGIVHCQWGTRHTFIYISMHNPVSTKAMHGSSALYGTSASWPEIVNWGTAWATYLKAERWQQMTIQTTAGKRFKRAKRKSKTDALQNGAHVSAHTPPHTHQKEFLPWSVCVWADSQKGRACSLDTMHSSLETPLFSAAYYFKYVMAPNQFIQIIHNRRTAASTVLLFPSLQASLLVISATIWQFLVAS